MLNKKSQALVCRGMSTLDFFMDGDIYYETKKKL